MLAIAFGVGWVFAAATGDDPQLVTTAYFLILVYAVFRWGTGRAWVGAAAILAVSSTVSFVLGSTTAGDVIGGLGVLVATVTLGVAFRWRAGARARELDRVKLVEREQLARDLHDTVAHHVSAIAIQAQAGTAVAATNPDAAAAALRTIEREASRTLAEMRSIVRVLRNGDDAERAPGPGLADLGALARTEPGSPVVAVQVAGDVEAVPPTIAAAVYRVAQEGVTNARRHARNVTRVDVRVQVDDAGIRLDVHDDGEPATSVSPGFGITGMQERATPARRHLLGRSRRRRRLDRRRGHPANGVGDVTVRVLVADDQELVRTGLRMILNAQPDIEVVGEAADGAEAVALARRLRPDVCLFDIRMPVLDGLDATRELAGPGVADPIPVVVITTFDLDEYVYAALRAGARGFLLVVRLPTRWLRSERSERLANHGPVDARAAVGKA